MPVDRERDRAGTPKAERAKPTTQAQLFETCASWCVVGAVFGVMLFAAGLWVGINVGGNNG